MSELCVLQLWQIEKDPPYTWTESQDKKKGCRVCMELLQTKHMYVLPIKILKQGGQELVFYNDVYEQPMNHIGRPRWYVKSPIAQDMFWPISSFISCAGVTRRWGLLSHAQNAAKVAGLIHTTAGSSSNVACRCCVSSVSMVWDQA